MLISLQTIFLITLLQHKRRFEKLGNETLQKMFDDPNFFLSVVLNHVIPGVYPSVILSDGEVIKAIVGYNLTVSVDDDTIMFNDATVLVPNVLAINGIVHGIDKVFLPDMPEESPLPTYSGMPAMAPAVDAGMPVTTPGLSPLTPPVDPDPTPMPVMAPVLREPTPPTSGAPYYGLVFATVTVVLVAVVM